MAYDETLKRLPDPNTIPAGPGFVSQALIDNTPGMNHPLNNGASISIQYAGSFWELNIQYPQQTISEASELIAFLYSLKGSFNDFYIQLPNYINPSSGAWVTTTNSNRAKGEITQGATDDSIVINNWEPVNPLERTSLEKGGDYVTGDMLKFDDSHKIYMVVDTELVEDVKTIWLNSTLLDTDLVSAGFEPNDIKFKVRLKGKTPSTVLDADGLYGAISLPIRENIL